MTFESHRNSTAVSTAKIMFPSLNLSSPHLVIGYNHFLLSKANQAKKVPAKHFTSAFRGKCLQSTRVLTQWSNSVYVSVPIHTAPVQAGSASHPNPYSVPVAEQEWTLMIWMVTSCQWVTTRSTCRPVPAALMHRRPVQQLLAPARSRGRPSRPGDSDIWKVASWYIPLSTGIYHRSNDMYHMVYTIWYIS